MRVIRKKCISCQRIVTLPWKRRYRKFCNRRCSYDYHTIHPKQKVCKQCGDNFTRKGKGIFCSRECTAKNYIGFHHSLKTKKLLSDQRIGILKIKRVPRECRMCNLMFLVQKTGKRSSKRFCSSKCYQQFLKTNNHMKRPEMRKRMSQVATSRSLETRRKIAAGMSKAWKDGKFNGVRTGKCHWYCYISNDGRKYKVQGSWELAFVHWLCRRRMKFKAHRKWIRYTDKNGMSRCWFPDFYVERWNEWIDIKSDYFYRPEKFAMIRKSNPDLKVRVLLRSDLEKLGVELYDKGNAYLPYLQDLVQRFRI